MKVKVIKTHRQGKVWVYAGTALDGVEKLRAENLERQGIVEIVSDVQTSAQTPKAAGKKKGAAEDAGKQPEGDAA